MKKIFVTGADGFIGSHLVELLVQEGFDVTALCIYNSNGSWGPNSRLNYRYIKQLHQILLEQVVQLNANL